MDPLAEIDKRAVLEALIARLAADLATLEASQNAAQTGATHVEARPEHAKDTRAIEATYLARGLAERSESLRDALTALSSLALQPLDPSVGAMVTALVTLEDDTSGVHTHYFLVPLGGGEKLEFGGHTVQTLTPVSPLGARLMGRVCGDEVVLERPRAVLRATIVGFA